ncbi:uncharacterized protein METZ01_LOCUS333276 [marine metagenome]|uniref:Methyltransferase type 11 domain-containing protein n=1 Tax=marine metagenome TaxID=408172 RepID=A0A382Q7G5_9ZZZZ
MLYGSGDILHTHLNLDPFTSDETDVIIRADVKNLDNFVDDAEAQEIVALDVIDYIPLGDINNVIKHWVSKLRHGGSLIIGGTDLFEVSKSFTQYRLGITETNQLIHGEQSKPYLIKRVNFTAMGLIDYLDSLGLNLQKKRVNNFHMTIEATRP